MIAEHLRHRKTSRESVSGLQAACESKSEAALKELSVDRLRQVAKKLGLSHEGLKPTLISRIAPDFGFRWILLRKALTDDDVAGWLRKLH